jgi:integrase
MELNRSIPREPSDRVPSARARYADQLVTRLGPLNLPTGRAYLTAKRAQGVADSTTVNCMAALVALDRDVNGQDFRTLQPADLTSALEPYSRGVTSDSARHHAILLRGFYAWLHDGECPHAIRRALKRVKTAELKDIVPITRDEFDALLHGANDPDADPREVYRRLAVLWTLWDRGFRISEMLSLRIRDVAFDGEGGALLSLPSDAPLASLSAVGNRLKSGTSFANGDVVVRKA